MLAREEANSSEGKLAMCRVPPLFVIALRRDGGVSHTFAGTLRLNVTGPVWASPTPAEDADYFYFAERPDLGYVGVYESYNLPPGGDSFGSIELYGRIGSLIPTRFDSASGVLLASEIPTAPVPEPENYAMMLAGLGLLGWVGRRRKQQAA